MDQPERRRRVDMTLNWEHMSEKAARITSRGNGYVHRQHGLGWPMALFQHEHFWTMKPLLLLLLPLVYWKTKLRFGMKNLMSEQTMLWFFTFPKYNKMKGLTTRCRTAVSYSLVPSPTVHSQMYKAETYCRERIYMELYNASSFYLFIYLF